MEWIGIAIVIVIEGLLIFIFAYCIGGIGKAPFWLIILITIIGTILAATITINELKADPAIHQAQSHLLCVFFISLPSGLTTSRRSFYTRKKQRRQRQGRR